MLSQREDIPPEQMTMDRLIARLKADAGFARDLIRLNRSFVFFARRDDLPPECGPIGGAGLPLTPLRSIAIDRTIWPYGLPVWIDATLPDGSGGDGAAGAADDRAGYRLRHSRSGPDRSLRRLRRRRPAIAPG